MLAKTYHKLPTEIIDQENNDWCMNMLITSIGREEEYRESLLNALKSVNVTASASSTIKSLESLLERQRNK